MAKTIATILGAGFLLVGIIGLISDDFLGMHLSTTHDIIHLVSGALSLYIGLRGTLATARLFSIIFGIVYGMLGVVGFLAGGHHTDLGVPGPAGPNILKIIPGALELGTMDHIVHILLGAVYLIGGLLTRAATRHAVDAERV